MKMPDNGGAPPSADSGVSGVEPEAIWKQVSHVGHLTSMASARRIWDSDDEQPESPESELEDDDSDPSGSRAHFALTPALAATSASSVIFALRADGQFDQHRVAFEEAAQVDFDNEIALERADLERFGSRYIVPFLLPYVESGFTRMCAEVGEQPPPFPMFTFAGDIYTFEPAPEGRHARDSSTK